MTRVDFHFNAADKLHYACRLVRKIHRSGRRIVVFSSSASQLADFDRMLWAFSPLDFIPHVAVDDRLAGDTPVLLARGDATAPHHEVIVNLGSDTPTHFSRFDRLVEIVSTDEADRAAGRERWKFYRDRGYPMHRHDCAA
jgi:DNA polymerase-3 subunit chi